MMESSESSSYHMTKCKIIYLNNKAIIMKMSLTKFHAQVLNAPVRNQQWSWGSENDEGIFLRVWLHEVENGKAIVRNIHQKKSAGLTERERHLNSLRQGKPAYAVILRSKDPKAEKNSIESYDQVIYPITKIEKDSLGIIWAEIDMNSPISPKIVNRLEVKDR